MIGRASCPRRSSALILLFLVLSHRGRDRGVVLVGDLSHLPAAGLRPALVRAPISAAPTGSGRPGSASGSRPSSSCCRRCWARLAALGIARLPKALRVVVAGLGLSPLIVPGIVVAIGIYYAFSRYGLVGSPAGLILAHTCLSVPFVVTSVSASLAGIDPRLGHAALSLGATPRATFFQVTLPLIRPGVLVGALFAFIHSFDQLIVALFISGSGAVTLPRRMWDDLRFAIDPTIAAVSTLTIVLTAALMWGAHLLQQPRRAPGHEDGLMLGGPPLDCRTTSVKTSQPCPHALVKSSCTTRSL